MLDRLLSLIFGTLITRGAWGRVHLMGHTEHLGCFTDPSAPTFHVRAMREDGTFAEHVYARAALFGVDKLTEHETRRAVVERAAGESWHACESFTRSAVLDDLCSKCAHTFEAHIEEATKKAARKAAHGALLALFGANSVILDDEDGYTWNGSGLIAEVLIAVPDAINHRRLTEAEWNRARDAGVPLRTFRPLAGEETLS